MTTFAPVTNRFIISLMLAAVAAELPAISRDLPVPREGVLDLRDTRIGRETLITLNGEWEFYWNTLLSPEDLKREARPENAMFVTVPSYWSAYEINDTTLPAFGCGTYALKVLLPGDFDAAICFDIPIFDCAFNFYINEMHVTSNGTVGTSRETEKPWYRPSSFCYAPRSDTLQLLVQVSNFHHRRGGFWQTMAMGGSGKIMDRIERRRMFHYSTIGVLFFFLLFYLVFWILSRKDIIMLLFALTVLGILIRTVNTGLFLSNSFVETSWSWQVRMEYLGTYLAHIFGMIFLHRIFHRDYMTPVIRINTALFSLAVVSVFILPVRLFSYGMLIFQPVIVLFLLHYLVISFSGMLNKRLTDAIFFFSLGLFIYTLLNDIMLANTTRAGYNSYLSPVAFQLFILAMAVMIIIQWVKSYHERELLESSLRFKNKVLSVIAHDLKNPVASVAQFTDLLVAKPELAGKQKIMDSLKESSHAAVSLLDNLLYWSRSQSDELSVSPESFEIRNLVDEVVSLFIHMSVQKEVDIRVNVPQGIHVYADRPLVNTVLRNLVSNAIKFTPGSGNVTIGAKEENNRVVISVTDTGTGIEPAIIARFEKEGKVPSSSGTNKELGTGLGLQLVRDLVTRNNGTLNIESTPGRGSRFTFTLPKEE